MFTMKSLKLLAVTSSIAMLMAISACATPPSDEPLLTEDEVGELMMTYMFKEINSKKYERRPFDLCDAFQKQDGAKDIITTIYKGQGKWLHTRGFCSFIIDDLTGQVTGP